MMEKKAASQITQSSLNVLFLLVASAMLSSYVVLRYRGLWGETDTNAFARAIRAMQADPRLVPAGYAYSNGYGFPVLAVFLTRVTGLSVAHLQIFGGGMLAIGLIFPIWLAYRELTGSGRGAALATALILVQPEFLFPILRGTHEKFTRGLMFFCLYLLVRSILVRQQWRRFAAYLLTFYLAIYALITFNNLLATSFIVALALSLTLSLLAWRLSGNTTTEESVATRQRLFYATLIALILAVVFTFYAYKPARHSILILDSVIDRLAVLFLEIEQPTVNPYQTIATAWISLPVYLMVSIANWLLLGISFVLWVGETLAWWRKRAWPDSSRELVLWSFYGASGFLGAVSIAVDISGAIASNLQHRIFPSFAMIAAPLVADRFMHWQPQRAVIRRMVYGVLTAGMAFLGVMAVAKATNEPLLSNKWNYYTSSEFMALDWSRHHYPDASTWAAFDERLRTAIGICCDWESEGARFDSWTRDAATRNLLISNVIRARAERLTLSLPIEGDSLRIYDNGASEIYHLRPRTPFQR